MLDLIEVMTRMTDLLEQHRAVLHALSLPPSDAALGRVQRTNLKVAKSFPKAVAIAENRLRIKEKSYAQSDDLTLGRAVQAVRMYEETRRTPYPGGSLEDRLITQAEEIKVANQKATSLFGRPVDYSSCWVFLVVRLVYAAERYRQRDACRNIVRLLAMKAIDERAAYYFAGQLLGGHVTVVDQFFHVTVEHTRKAQVAVVASSHMYAEYQSALDAFRFASPMYQNNPEAVKILCDTIDMIANLLAVDLVDFRTRCAQPPGLSELVTRHLTPRVAV